MRSQTAQLSRCPWDLLLASPGSRAGPGKTELARPEKAGEAPVQDPQRMRDGRINHEVNLKEEKRQRHSVEDSKYVGGPQGPCNNSKGGTGRWRLQ